MAENGILNLSEKENSVLFPSLLFVNTNLDIFVKKFFDYLLRTEVVVLFEKTNMEELEKKFQSSFKIILYNFQHPINLNDHMKLLISKHLESGIMPEHIDKFYDCFMKTINDMLVESFNEHVIKIWQKLILQLLAYFRKKLY